MATADEYADWIVKNQDKKGSQEFNTVALAYQQAKGEEVKTPTQPQPEQGYAGSPANAGFGKYLTNIVGLPGDTAQNAVNLLRAGYGVAKGAITGDGGSAPEPLRAQPFTSEWLQQKLGQLADKTGIVGLRTDNPSPNDPLRSAAYEFTARGGVVPGQALPAALSIVGEKLAGPAGSMAGAMLPGAARNVASEVMAPKVSARQMQNQMRDASAKEGLDAGYVLPPAVLNPSATQKTLLGVAGKDATTHEVIQRNQQVTNKLVRDEFNLPENTPISVGLLDKLRDQFSSVYKEVGNLSPSASAALQRLRQERADSNLNWKHYERSADPDAMKAAKAADARSEMLETFLEKQAARSGKPELIDQLRAARTNIAKTYDVERALNTSTGEVDARILANALDRNPGKITGNLKTIADFSNSFRKYTGEGGATPVPSSGRLSHLASTGLGAAGFAAAGPSGLLAAAIPYMDAPTRSLILSNSFQRNFARPDYTLPNGVGLPDLAGLSLIANETQK